VKISLVKTVCIASLFSLLASLASEARDLDHKNENSLFIRNVTIIPMTGGNERIANVSVEVRRGKVVKISRQFRTIRCSARNNCIDGRGKWLIPGLTDSHVHIENDRMLQLYMGLPQEPEGAVSTSDMGVPFIANGVTQVFNLSAMRETFRQNEEIASGRAIGPRIITAYMLDGARPILPEGIAHGVANPEAGRQAVRDAKREGYDLIKVYSLLDTQTFLAIVDEAKKNDLKVVGHIPGREQGKIEDYFVSGFSAVAHAEEFALQTSEPDEGKIQAYVALAKNNGTALMTTLTLDERILEETENPDSLKNRSDLDHLNPMLHAIVHNHNPYVAQSSPDRVLWLKKIVRFNQKLVKAFSEANLSILAGSDSPVPGLAPGFALIDELEALVRSGLTPYQAIYSATKAPCDWLGSKCGTIAVGRNADLLLLDADPTLNISNIRRLSSVIANGRLYSKAELDQKMQLLRNRVSPPNNTGH